MITRKQAMDKAKGWGSKGLNYSPIDKEGSMVAAAWWRVVDATDGGTQEQIEDATTKAEQAEAEFYASHNT